MERGGGIEEEVNKPVFVRDELHETAHQSVYDTKVRVCIL